jgi:hypothetical protein
VADSQPGDGWRLLQCLAGLCMIVAVFLPWFPASPYGDPPISYFQFAWAAVPEKLFGTSTTREHSLGNGKIVVQPPRQHPAVSIGAGLLLLLIGMTGVFVILQTAPDTDTATNGTQETPPRLTPTARATRMMFELFWRWPAGVSLVVFGFCWLAGLAQTGAPGV